LESGNLARSEKNDPKGRALMLGDKLNHYEWRGWSKRLQGRWLPEKKDISV